MLRACAQSSMAVTSASDCETKASAPLCASAGATLAFSRACGASRPTQSGPRMRISVGRAASSMACFCTGVRPALMTTAALAPARASCPIRSTTVAGGVQTRASSGTPGSSRTRA